MVCSRRGSDDRFPLGQFDCFGESALDEGLPEAERVRKADVVADGKCTVAQLLASSFNSLLGHSLADVAAKNFTRKTLAGVRFDGTPLTAMLSSADTDKLVAGLSEANFADGETVIEEGAIGDAFYLIQSGAARVSTRQKGDLAELGEGDFFGEMALLRSEPRMASVSAIGSLKCLTLNRITFTRLLGPLQERLSIEMDRRDKAKGAVRFADLEMKQLIGIGSFGHVRLALHRPTGEAYALKVMYKGQVVHTHQVQHVLQEKEILKRCAHPFIASLIASYKDADHLYLLTELVQGGELLGVLRGQGRLHEPVCAFYAATVTSAFEYLHDRKLIYRDLKPENLLLDSVGYLKLVDFGFAKEVRRTLTAPPRAAHPVPPRATSRYLALSRGPHCMHHPA